MAGIEIVKATHACMQGGGGGGGGGKEFPGRSLI